MRTRTRNLTANALFAAIAYLIMFIIHIPVNSFLTYDPKNVVIAIAGIIFGPASALVISLVVSFLEMITASDTGFIGFIMNFLAAISFSCVAALIYRIRKNVTSLWVGLIVATAAMTASMIFWNYLITPLYLEVSREAVMGMIPTLLLPFNLIKGLINSAAVLVLYKPIENALYKADLLKYKDVNSKTGAHVASAVIGVILLVIGVASIFIFKANL